MPEFNVHAYPVVDPMTQETIELPNDGWQTVVAADKYRAVEQLLNDISKAKGTVFVPDIVYVELRRTSDGSRMVEQFSIASIH